MKESTLQTLEIQYLTTLTNRYDDLFFFSIPNEGLMFTMMLFGISKETSARVVNHFKKTGMISGVPDLCILFQGNCFFIENKKKGKLPSENQLRIHDKIKQAGFEVFVIDNFEGFKELLDMRGIV